MASTEAVPQPEKIIEIINTSQFEDSQLYKDILQQSFVTCNTLSVGKEQMYPFVYSIASKNFPHLFRNTFATEQSSKSFEKFYHISLSELEIEYSPDLPIMEILNAIFFDEFREIIKKAFITNQTVAIKLFVGNMKTGAGKPQRELMTAARNSCQCLIDNANLLNEIKAHDETLIFPVIDILRYNKDFRSDILVSSSTSPSIILNQKQIISNENGSIVKLCELINKIGNDIDNFKNGIIYIFKRFGWLSLNMDQRNYLFDLLIKYNKISLICSDYIKKVLGVEISITAKKKCTDDTFLEECECDKLMLCGNEKLCPESAKYSQVECKPLHGGGVDYMKKYLKYKRKYIMEKGKW